jgi:hypothetical protein
MAMAHYLHSHEHHFAKAIGEIEANAATAEQIEK